MTTRAALAGSLPTAQDDLLALTFEVTGQSFLNVGFDLSAIDVQGCGGPFGTDVPIMQVSLYDTPSGTFSFGAMGTQLDQGLVTGVASSSPWTFAWTYGIFSLAASKATGKISDGFVRSEAEWLCFIRQSFDRVIAGAQRRRHE